MRGQSSPDPDLQRQPADNKLESNNKGLLFEATKFWVICYSVKAKVATISSVLASQSSVWETGYFIGSPN